MSHLSQKLQQILCQHCFNMKLRPTAYNDTLPTD